MRIVLVAVLSVLMSGTTFGEPLSRGLFGCERGKPCPPPHWQKVEADNGTVFYADTAIITPSSMIPGGRQILIYRDDGSQPNIDNTGWFTFYCSRPLVLPPGLMQQPEYVPPRSILGTIRDMACGSYAPQPHPATNNPSDDDIRNAIRGLKEAVKDPQKVRVLECMGVKVYQDPQPVGHPPSPDECKIILAAPK